MADDIISTELAGALMQMHLRAYKHAYTASAIIAALPLAIVRARTSSREFHARTNGTDASSEQRG